METKQELRLRAKEIRKTLDLAKISKNAVRKIRSIAEYKSAENVLIFYPMRYEINLLELLDDDKQFFLPKVCGKKLLICPFKKGDRLEKSCFNIHEPCTEPFDTDFLDLAIVPALMADEAGFRLGYGGGFYDRFLAIYADIKTICPVPKELYIKMLPHDEFDKKINSVIIC